MEPRTERLSSCPKGTRLMGKGAGMKMQMPPLQAFLSISVPWSFSHCASPVGNSAKIYPLHQDHTRFTPVISRLFRVIPKALVIKKHDKRESQKETNTQRMNMYIFFHYLNTGTISSGKFRIISWKIIGRNAPILNS